jgi:hypothetical protein
MDVFGVTETQSLWTLEVETVHVLRKRRGYS